MLVNHSLFDFFSNAGPIVRAVIFILLATSLISWTFIFQRIVSIRRVKRSTQRFEKKFWTGVDLSLLYQELTRKEKACLGSERIFVDGFKELTRLRKLKMEPELTMTGVKRALSIAQDKEMLHLEHNLPLLATIGSVSPYVGLFGTVWGIMTSFQALGEVQQATIAMVAPGISEALIATAVGLFAAIPAVVAYNRFSNNVEELYQNMQLFQQELLQILFRQLYRKPVEASPAPTLESA